MTNLSEVLCVKRGSSRRPQLVVFKIIDILKFIMQKIEYKNFIAEWSGLFPEFLEWVEYDPEYYTYEGEPQAYTYLSDFCRLMMQKVEASTASEDPFLIKIFNVINQQYELLDSDANTLTLITVEIFENLAQTKRGMEISRKFLTNEKAIHDFRESLKFTSIESW